MARDREDLRSTEENTEATGRSETTRTPDGQESSAPPDVNIHSVGTRGATTEGRAVPASDEHTKRSESRTAQPTDISGAASAAGSNARNSELLSSKRAGGRTPGRGSGHVKDVHPPRQRESVPPGRPMVPDKEDDEIGGAANHVLKNYASRNAGAVMLESSSGSKGMGNLLLDDLDSYAISPCEEKQWVVFGLSEDIMVRTIKIISHEKYSSLVKDFQVLASPTYPVNEWLDLGTFTAKYAQGEQTFEVPEPALARYLKFKFLTHYGHEFYCTVSQVKVQGSTMLESFQDEWQQNSDEIREVKDYMMTKKEAKNALNSANGSSSSSSSSDAGIPPAPAGIARETLPSVTNGSQAAQGVAEHKSNAASVESPPREGSGGTGAISPGDSAKDVAQGVPSEVAAQAAGACQGAGSGSESCVAEIPPTEVPGTMRAQTGESSSSMVETSNVRAGGVDVAKADGRPVASQGQSGLESTGVGADTASTGVVGGVDIDTRSAKDSAENSEAATRVASEGKPREDKVGVEGATSGSSRGGGESGEEGPASRGSAGELDENNSVGAGLEEPAPRKGITQGTAQRTPGEGVDADPSVIAHRMPTEKSNPTVSQGSQGGMVGEQQGSSAQSPGNHDSSSASEQDPGRQNEVHGSNPVDEDGGGDLGSQSVGSPGGSTATSARGERNTGGLPDTVGDDAGNPAGGEARRRDPGGETTIANGVGAVGEGGRGASAVLTNSSKSPGDSQNLSATPSVRSGGPMAFEVQTEAYGEHIESPFDSSPEGVQQAELASRLARADPAALVASCLDRLNFAEFQEEVLERTQQAQHPVGGGVKISGQYESIFKTLMNKIKTLEINQSLFNLYVDEVHGCYQEVIEHMLAEQERTRASLSQLLDIQSASLTKIGNQWPAFHELQGRVVQIEGRMVLGSTAWFSSLLCLVILLSSCLVKTCRFVSGASRHERGHKSLPLKEPRVSAKDRSCESFGHAGGATDGGQSTRMGKGKGKG